MLCTLLQKIGLGVKEELIKCWEEFIDGTDFLTVV